MPDKTIYESPRLKQLLEELKENKTKALTRFWQDVKSAGIPYIEAYETNRRDEQGKEERVVDEAHVLATFLYDGDESTRHVSLGAQFMSRIDENPDNWMMLRLEGTNIWYWTEKVRSDLRTGYFLTPNHPQTPAHELNTPEKRHAFLKAICQHDPLNEKRFERPFYPFQMQGTNERVFQSVFEAPNAVPELYSTERPIVAKGRVTEHRQKSQFFDYEHIFWVYTPANYEPERAKAYPFLLLFDGYLCLEALKLPTILDNLIVEGKIPPLVCMMLNSESETRYQELSPNDLMPRAISKDWIPFIRENYHISADPMDNIIGGMSLGGLGAAWNALNHPELFGNVISQSGSFWWFPASNKQELKNPDDTEQGWLIRRFVEGEQLNLRFYMDVGRYENDEHGWSHLSLNRHMRDVLRAKGYPVVYQEYVGFHDHIWWQITIVDALTALTNHVSL